MNTLRGADGSIMWNFEPDEEAEEVSPLHWEDVTKYFLEIACQHDPAGDFIIMENFTRHGKLLGYEALRTIPVAVAPAELDSVPPYMVGADIPQCRFPALSELVHKAMAS